MNTIREDVKKKFLEMLRSSFKKLNHKTHHGCAYTTTDGGEILYSPIGLLAKAVKTVENCKDDFWGGGKIASDEAIRTISGLEDIGLSFEEIANHIDSWPAQEATAANAE